MAKKSKKQQTKKVLEINVFTRLNAALSEYHNLVGEKKFTKHLKKTAKLFANDITSATEKQHEKLEKEVKKMAKKTAKKGPEKKDKKVPLKKKGEKKMELVIPETTGAEMEKPAE